MTLSFVVSVARLSNRVTCRCLPRVRATTSAGIPAALFAVTARNFWLISFTSTRTAASTAGVITLNWSSPDVRPATRYSDLVFDDP